MKVKMGPYWRENEQGNNINIPEDVIEKLKVTRYPVTVGFVPKSPQDSEVPLEKIIGTLDFDSIEDNFIIANFNLNSISEKDIPKGKFAMRALCKSKLHDNKIIHEVKHILCWDLIN